jgi:lysophospholipase L1-like esterase
MKKIKWKRLNFHRKLKNNSVKILFITSISLFILFDLTAKKLIYYFNNGKEYIIKNPIYHHDLKKNFVQENYFQFKRYRIITNSLGFRDSKIHNIEKNSSKRRLVFIGDSFTEGVGLNYEDTFVGIIDAYLSKYSISVLNAGVSSYSPKIYYRKIKNLIENEGINFSDLIVYIDISDIEDEALFYSIDENYNIISREKKISQKNTTYNYIKNLLENNTFIIFNSLSIVKEFIRPTPEHIKLKSFKRARLDNLYSNYGFEESLKYMNKLYELCVKNQINLIVSIYPWPTQILEEDLNSKQVQIWNNWSLQKKIELINYFPLLVKENISNEEKKKIIEKFYFKNDVHFNKDGNKIIAEYFIKNFLKQ